MRKTFACWLLGLAAVSTTVGCGAVREARVGRCGASGCAATTVTRDRVVARAGKVRESEQVVLVDKAPPAPTKFIEPVKRLPDAPGTDKSIKKIDLQVEENAIINRELAKSGGKPTPNMPEIIVPDAKVVEGVKEKNAELKNETVHFGPEGDFKTVTGQVQQFRKSWRLRYADPGQEDIYGGGVMLEGDLSKLREGAIVRVTGTLVPAPGRTGQATYRVQGIEILD